MPSGTFEIFAHLFVPIISSIGAAIVAAICSAWLYRRKYKDSIETQARDNFDRLSSHVENIGHNVNSIKDVFSTRMDSFDNALSEHSRIATENSMKMEEKISSLDNKLWSLVMTKEGRLMRSAYAGIAATKRKS